MTTDSAHRSSTPAHRSGGSGELKTEVFIVKTPDAQDAVIVSFVDDGENNGIFLYEPGADPVELTAVGQEDHASEFEYAHIFGETVDGEEVQWPGDGMVTRAERDAAVESRAEGHENLQQAYDTLREQAEALTVAVKDVHDGSHSGPFAFCTLPECVAAMTIRREL
jgi:hypothetical protein